MVLYENKRKKLDNQKIETISKLQKSFEMNKKFIIYDGDFIFGTVSHHKDLLPRKFEISKICGGGQFELTGTKFRFFNKSSDFGRFDEKLVLSLPIIGIKERIVTPLLESEDDDKK